MRKALLVALISLAVIPQAHAGTERATLAVTPSVFSPQAGRTEIAARLEQPAPFGLQISSASGKVLGWLRTEAPRTVLAVDWHGTLAGRRLPDGNYRLSLVSRGQLLRQAPFRIDTTAPIISKLRIVGGGVPYAGDGPLLATITPNGDGLRDHATIRFTLSEAASVVITAETTTNATHPVFEARFNLAAGPSSYDWLPPPTLGPRTYLIRISATDDAGNRRSLGRLTASSTSERGPVVRIQGVDAAFTRTSAAPGARAVLHVATDAAAFTLQLFREQSEPGQTVPDNELAGVAVGPVETIDWHEHRNAPGDVQVVVPQVASGIYFARLVATDGRIGFAPLIVRPALLGEHRVAVVIPTNTWQAYNFYDADGNGWGDTWYAGGTAPPVQLTRPFLRHGVPPFFRRYDMPFQQWLVEHSVAVDTITDDELETSTAADLSSAYDLIVFPGHHEYVTDSELAAVTGFRDRGGNLLFLSANNFFWRVERTGQQLRRTRQWRDLGKPEAGLIGVQYRGNDEGQRQAPFIVRDTTSAPWVWEGTGLTVGSPLGSDIGGYGTEIDGTSPASPPGTIVLAEVPDLLGPGKTAQMTYYETPQGARVFAAGTLDFGGSVLHQPQDRLLQNIWARLSQP